ncbi:MAG: SDR family NAD(P)-dependent oxidoreductase [Hyphomicrobiaceae bacterium]
MIERALIVGAGDGISASFARRLAKDNVRVLLASRSPDKLSGLVAESGGKAVACDVAKPDDVRRLFELADSHFGTPDVVLFNPSFRTRGPIVELNPDDVAQALTVGALGGFLVGQEAARRMLARGKGAIFFTGASASVKGYAQSAPFAMAKFALRGLAQSMARELQPKNIHVAHFVIDGGVASPIKGRIAPADQPDSLLDPDAIAETYWAVLHQHRSAWTSEIELRPWVERF